MGWQIETAIFSYNYSILIWLLGIPDAKNPTYNY